MMDDPAAVDFQQAIDAGTAPMKPPPRQSRLDSFFEVSSRAVS